MYAHRSPFHAAQVCHPGARFAIGGNSLMAANGSSVRLTRRDIERAKNFY
jgi:hypothetical protein